MNERDRGDAAIDVYLVVVHEAGRERMPVGRALTGERRIPVGLDRSDRKTRRGGKLKSGTRTIYSGEFWTGRKAVDLGLADGIGDLRTTMRGRYGEKVKLTVVEARKGLVKRRLGLGPSENYAPASLVDGILDTFGARALWARYGL